MIYQILVARNKSGDRRLKSVSCMKSLLYREHESCAICGQNMSKSFLEIDHIIPVAVGGKVFEESNLQLLCCRCHQRKTNGDTAAIAALRKLGFTKILGPVEVGSTIHPAELQEMFSVLRENLIKNKEAWDVYFDKPGGSVWYTENRPVPQIPIKSI